MITIYTDLCILFGINVGAFCVILAFNIKELNGISFFILMLLYGFLTAPIFNYITMRRLNKINKNLYNDCNITKYIEEYQKVYKKNTQKVFDITFRISLSTGYINLGQFEKALELLENGKPKFKNNKIDTYNKIAYYNNLAIIYLQLNNLEKAREMIDKMKENINNSKLDKIKLEETELLYETRKIELELAKEKTLNNLENAKGLYLKLLENANKNNKKVYYNYKLAEIYKEFGDKEKEEKCFSYIIENGGDTYYVQKVKELMNK
ncbi:MAG: tetratricopeptide repeat protein [Clostridia bacterium]|nr:tetratricopeptide repeat protein [Clostridia bacterium]